MSDRVLNTSLVTLRSYQMFQSTMVYLFFGQLKNFLTHENASPVSEIKTAIKQVENLNNISVFLSVFTTDLEYDVADWVICPYWPFFPKCCLQKFICSSNPLTTNLPFIQKQQIKWLFSICKSSQRRCSIKCSPVAASGYATSGN